MKITIKTTTVRYPTVDTLEDNLHTHKTTTIEVSSRSCASTIVDQVDLEERFKPMTTTATPTTTTTTASSTTLPFVQCPSRCQPSLNRERRGSHEPTKHGRLWKIVMRLLFTKICHTKATRLHSNRSRGRRPLVRTDVTLQVRKRGKFRRRCTTSMLRTPKRLQWGPKAKVVMEVGSD